MSGDPAVSAVILREGAGIDPRLFSVLTMRLGSPDEILDASDSRLRSVPELSASQIARIVASRRRREKVAARVSELRERGIRVVTLLDDDYPEGLRALGDAPPYLYVRGTWPTSSCRIYVTGRQDVGEEDIAATVGLTRYISEAGHALVTGLNPGVELAAHVGVIAASGQSLAVCASGLEALELPEQVRMAAEIVTAGVICSEFPETWAARRTSYKSHQRLLIAFSSALLLIDVPGPRQLRTLLDLTQREGKPVFFMASADAAATRRLLSAGAYPIADRAGLDLIFDYI